MSVVGDTVEEVDELTERPGTKGRARVGAARTMIERTEDRLGLAPERVAADRHI